MRATHDTVVYRIERLGWQHGFDQDALVALWQKEEPSVGTMSFETTLGYLIRPAYAFPNEQGRHLVLVTDRPIAGVEAMRGTRSMDYPIGWIEIDVDQEGKGEGKLYGAVELSVETDTGEIKLIRATAAVDSGEAVNPDGTQAWSVPAGSGTLFRFCSPVLYGGSQLQPSSIHR